MPAMEDACLRMESLDIVVLAVEAVGDPDVGPTGLPEDAIRILEVSESYALQMIDGEPQIAQQMEDMEEVLNMAEEKGLGARGE